MTAQQTHYEIHTYNGKAWSINNALDDQDDAKQMAKALFATGTHKGVKVSKERYDDGSGTFSALTILQLGQAANVKRMAERDDPLARIEVCRKPTDLYTYEGRRSIRIQLGTTLDHWAITPTELLHEPSYYLKLDNAGTVLQNAIQRAAVKQIQGTDIPVQERMRELYALISKTYHDLKALLAKSKLPDLKKTPLLQYAEKLKDEHQRTTILSAAISSSLAAEKDIWSKFSFTLTLLRPGLPGWVLDILDNLFAEMMQTPAILKGIMQAQQNDSELDRMIGLVHLRRGRAALDGFDVFNRFIIEGKLANTQTALQQLLLQQMRSGGPLSQGDLNDQLDAIVSVKDACGDDLSQDDRFSKDIYTAITTRCEKALSNHSINAYMAQTVGPLERAKRLLNLAPKVFGPLALRQLAEQIEPILVPHDQQVIIRKNMTNPLQGMAALRQVQILVNKARFQERSTARMNQALDDVCMALLTATNLIEKLMKSDLEDWQKALKFLTLLSKATFVEGRSATGVRVKTRDIMKGSNLLDELMKSATTQQEQVAQLKSFMDLLQAAGMGEQSNKLAMAG